MILIQIKKKKKPYEKLLMIVLNNSNLAIKPRKGGMPPSENKKHDIKKEL